MMTTQEGFHPSSVQATIEQLRYWVPTIKDVAHVFEGNEDECWLLSIEPVVAAACPVALALRETGRFDIAIAGETYEDRLVGKLEELVLLLERITQGQIIQRRWVSSVTGVERGIETIILLGDGAVWRDGPEPDGYGERHDRHFLPYRRG